MTRQLTIRFDEDLEREIESLVVREGVSRNVAVGRLLRKGAGLDQPAADHDAVGDALDWFIGSWTSEQAAEFERATADFEVVDEELWK